MKGYKGEHIGPGGPPRPPDTLARYHGRTQELPPQFFEEFPFSQETMERSKKNLTKDLMRLIDMVGSRDDAEFHRFLEDSGHGYYIELFDRLTKVKQGTAGRVREINTDLLDKFIQTDEGLQKIYRITQDKIREVALTAALFANINPREAPARLVESQSATANRGGMLREVARSFIHQASLPVRHPFGRGMVPTPHIFGHNLDFLRIDNRGRLEAVWGGSTIALGTIGGLAGGPVGAAVGGAIPTALGGIMYEMRRGQRINLNQAAEALQIIIGNEDSPTPQAQVGNPAQMDFMKGFYQMDPRDLEIHNGQIRFREGYSPQTGVDAKTIRDNIMGWTKEAIAFQKEAHVKREHTTLDLSWIMRGDLAPPQQGASDISEFDERVKEHFSANRGGILDVHGEQIEIEHPPRSGNWIRNNQFDPEHLDTAGNAQRWIESYRGVLRKEITEVFQSIVDRDTPYASNLQEQIDKRRAAHQEEAKRELNPRDREAMQSDAAELKEDTDAFSGYKKIHRSKTLELQQHEAELRKLLGKITRPQGWTDQQLTNAILTDSAVHGLSYGGVDIFDVRAEIKRLHRQRLIDIRNEKALLWQAAPKGQKTDLTDSLKHIDTNITAQYQQDIEDEKQKLQAYQQFRQNFLAQAAAIDACRNALNGAATGEGVQESNDTVARTYDTMKNMRDNFRDVTSWHRRGNNLNQAALQTESLETLLQRVNRAWQRNHSNGWPANENNNPENRQRLLMAMAEARAEGNTPATQAFTQAIDPNLWGLEEFQLLSLTAEEIDAHMQGRLQTVQQANVGINAVPNRQQIDGLKNLALRRFSSRQRALSNLSQEIAERNERQEKRTAEGKVETPGLDAIEKAKGRYENITEWIRNASDHDLEDFLNPARASTEPTHFTAEEQRHSIAYVRMMDLVFGHSDDYEVEYNEQRGTDAAFRRNQTLIDETQLRDELRSAFDIPNVVVPGHRPRVPSFEETVTMVRARLGLPHGTIPRLVRGIQIHQTRSRRNMGEFLSERMIFRNLAPRVRAL